MMREGGKERKGEMEEGRGNGTEIMGGTGEDMGRDGEGREGRNGSERDERGYSPRLGLGVF